MATVALDGVVVRGAGLLLGGRKVGLDGLLGVALLRTTRLLVAVRREVGLTLLGHGTHILLDDSDWRCSHLNKIVDYQNISIYFDICQYFYKIIMQDYFTHSVLNQDTPCLDTRRHKEGAKNYVYYAHRAQ